MNRQILDPLRSIGIPEKIDEFLDDQDFSAISFNKWGTILAAGCVDGLIALYDFQARSLGIKLQGHKSTIVCLCWSKNGKFLISCSSDNQIIQWDVSQAKQLYEKQVDQSYKLSSIDVHPLQPQQVILNFGTTDSLVIDFTQDTSQKLPSIDINPPNPVTTHQNQNQNDQQVNGIDKTLQESNEENKFQSTKAKNDNQDIQKSETYISLAIYGRNGQLIYAVQPKGVILVINSEDYIIYDIIRIGGANILELQQNYRGSYLITNASDRILRLYKCIGLSEILHMGNKGYSCEYVQKAISSKLIEKQQIPYIDSILWNSQFSCLVREKEFQNFIDRTSWFGVQFNVDAEYVASGVDNKTEHLVYIWDRHFGKLEQILEGPKEGLGGILWHPQRSILLTISKTKRKIYIWDKQYRENWSAFAPGFEELEENREYIEKETEFDINSNDDLEAIQDPLQALQNPKAKENGKDMSCKNKDDHDDDYYNEQVDIEGFGDYKEFSSDEESQDTKYLPVVVSEDLDETQNEKQNVKRAKY